jgi:hypothetical protein
MGFKIKKEKYGRNLIVPAYFHYLKLHVGRLLGLTELPHGKGYSTCKSVQMDTKKRRYEDLKEVSQVSSSCRITCRSPNRLAKRKKEKK